MSRFKATLSLMVLSFFCLTSAAVAQAPTGIIEGAVNDATGAVIPNASVTITNKATGVARTATTTGTGTYSAPALPAGDYEIKIEANGFRTQISQATLQVGADVTVNGSLAVGSSQEVVNVEASAAQLNYESNAVTGVINRATIQDLPLNGRSFMQLASLEPGVTIAAGSTAQFNTLFTVSVLGGGNRTVFTIDGGNISDNIDVGGGISSMNFSQDMVQEFQLSSVVFDLTTPISSGGAINIVSRSGSNEFHGSGYFFFRDHNTAAYPSLARPILQTNVLTGAQQLSGPTNPFFARRNPGVWIGGPIKKDKLFFFANFEYFNQVNAIGIFSTSASTQPLQGDYNNPYKAKQTSVRLDYHVNDKNNAFLRYSHDGNTGFGQSLEFGDPSNWAHNTNWADQSIIGLTTTFTPAVVNDARIQYNYWNNHNLPASASDCSLPCVAGVLPNVFTILGSNQPAIGPNFNAPQGRNTRRKELNDTVSWQKGAHRMRFGGDLNLTASNGYWGFCASICLGAYSTEFINANVPAAFIPALFPTLPKFLTSDASVLNLPVLNVGSSIFSGVGVGNVSTPAPYGYNDNVNYNQYRAYFQDTWKIRPNLTLNYGLAWNAQTGFYNSDLPRPAFLAPILGANSLGGTRNNVRQFEPAVGFTWSPDGKTVIRGGGGIYWDSTPGYYKLRDAAAVGPPGNGRSTLAASAFVNNIPGIVNVGAGGAPIAIGAPLPLTALTTMTVGQFVNLVNTELPTISAVLAPSNPVTSGAFQYSEIDYAKQGVEIYPQNFPIARSYQTSIGVQHELPGNLLVQVDYARRLGINTSLGEVDQNLFTRYLGTTVPQPVIPYCAAPGSTFEKSSNGTYYLPGQECSTGSITFWNNEGRSLYNGLLVKVQKRFSHNFQSLVSYAYQRGYGETVWNDASYGAGWGQNLPHQNLNISGSYNMPLGFQISLNSSMISAAPGTVSVSSLDLSGTVPSGSTEPLPGLPYGCVNVSCSAQQIVNAVNLYDATIAGTASAKGSSSLNPGVKLPPHFATGNPILSQDLRVTKSFTAKERYRFDISVDIFNVLNIGNYTLPSLTLDGATATSFSFGQYTTRVGQSLGQGGPRAFQFGGRFSF